MLYPRGKRPIENRNQSLVIFSHKALRYISELNGSEDSPNLICSQFLCEVAVLHYVSLNYLNIDLQLNTIYRLPLQLFTSSSASRYL
jgi:hypothetical protein